MFGRELERARSCSVDSLHIELVHHSNCLLAMQALRRIRLGHVVFDQTRTLRDDRNVRPYCHEPNHHESNKQTDTLRPCPTHTLRFCWMSRLHNRQTNTRKTQDRMIKTTGMIAFLAAAGSPCSSLRASACVLLCSIRSLNRTTFCVHDSMLVMQDCMHLGGGGRSLRLTDFCG